MSLAEKQLSPDRVQFHDSLSSREIASLVQDRRVRVIQTSGPVNATTWVELNARLFSHRPDIQLRVFGFYSGTCDLSFLWAMDNVRHFSADCLTRVQNIDAIARMASLRTLGIGVFELEDFNFLRDLPADIEGLFLGATRSRKPDLRPLERFGGLKKLSVEGQRKNIEVLSSLLELEDVTLRSVTAKDLSFLTPLSKMWSLDIKLGGSNDLQTLSGMNSIKYLELWQVRGLADLSPISSLAGLQYLFLQSLPQVVALPDLRRLIKLRRVHLDNMKGIRSLDALCGAPSLEDLIHVDAQAQKPEDYLCLLRSGTMREFRVGFGSETKNAAFRSLLATHKKVWHEFSPFAFAN
jgi:hypothetical protein